MATGNWAAAVLGPRTPSPKSLRRPQLWPTAHSGGACEPYNTRHKQRCLHDPNSPSPPLVVKPVIQGILDAAEEPIIPVPQEVMPLTLKAQEAIMRVWGNTSDTSREWKVPTLKYNQWQLS